MRASSSFALASAPAFSSCSSVPRLLVGRTAEPRRAAPRRARRSRAARGASARAPASSAERRAIAPRGRLPRRAPRRALADTGPSMLPVAVSPASSAPSAASDCTSSACFASELRPSCELLPQPARDEGQRQRKQDPEQPRRESRRDRLPVRDGAFYPREGGVERIAALRCTSADRHAPPITRGIGGLRSRGRASGSGGFRRPRPAGTGRVWRIPHPTRRGWASSPARHSCAPSGDSGSRTARSRSCSCTASTTSGRAGWSADALDPIDTDVLVDLSWCTFVDSSVIALILGKHAALESAGHTLEIILPRPTRT